MSKFVDSDMPNGASSTSASTATASPSAAKKSKQNAPVNTGQNGDNYGANQTYNTQQDMMGNVSFNNHSGGTMNNTGYVLQTGSMIKPTIDASSTSSTSQIHSIQSNFNIPQATGCIFGDTHGGTNIGQQINNRNN